MANQHRANGTSPGPPALALPPTDDFFLDTTDEPIADIAHRCGYYDRRASVRVHVVGAVMAFELQRRVADQVLLFEQCTLAFDRALRIMHRPRTVDDDVHPH